MRKRVLVGFGLTMVLSVSACSANDDAVETTAEYRVDGVDLIGTWRCAACGSAQVHFEEDGTYRIVAGSPTSQDFVGATVEQGQFTLEGTLFTFISNEDSQNCEAGQRGTSEMEALEPGRSGQDRLQQTKVQDECLIRGSVSVATLERVP